MFIVALDLSFNFLFSPLGKGSTSSCSSDSLSCSPYFTSLIPSIKCSCFLSNGLSFGSLSYYSELTWAYWMVNYWILSLSAYLSSFFSEMFYIGVSSSRGSTMWSSTECFALLGRGFLAVYSFSSSSISSLISSYSYENPWDSENSSSSLIKSILRKVLAKYLTPACLQSVNFKIDDQMHPMRYRLPALTNNESKVF